MNASAATEVLIVGAGPVGLVLACDLARRGVAVRIVERAEAFQVGTRARGVRARTQEVFEDLGVLDRLVAHAEAATGTARFYDAAGNVVREAVMYDAPPVPGAPYPGSLMVGQQFTEAVLRERLASFGVKVELGGEFVDYEEEDGQVTASVRFGGRVEEIRARYLVGCDGGGSTVRKRAGISFLGETWERQRMLFGNLRVEGLDDSVAHLWGAGPGGMLSLAPMPKSGTWFFTAPLPQEDGLDPAAVSVETFAEAFAERVGLPGVRFSDPVYLSVYQVNIRMVDRYREGRVLLAGDAAHVHAPAGGQGMNTGVQDAYNLGWKLARVLRGAPGALLDTYEEERLPVAAHVLASTTARGKYWSGKDAAEVSDRLVGTFAGRDPFSDVSQLSLGYRGSSLARQLDEGIGVRAGDRAPDAVCTDQSGARVRLFERFRGPHATLLVFGDRTAPEAVDRFGEVRTQRVRAQGEPPAEGDLVDADGEARERYGVAGDGLVLVRPDGYIALAGGDWDGDVVSDHLAHPGRGGECANP
ncbi:FAD-dependent oxidoreductase [Glycomyces endophyticus]|uniref:FAD-dependent oxidoreductase n=1 Tax=Glycomyces endophyticus TaxID=480996 RepID=A0ABP4T335_9ACTN